MTATPVRHDERMPTDGTSPSDVFLDLLYEEAPPASFDAVVAAAVDAGVSGTELERLRGRLTVALRIRDQVDRQRQREAELSALYETASDLTAIRDVDLEVADGEFVSVVGPTGCGKSTTLSLVSGLEPATAGTVSVHGTPVTAIPDGVLNWPASDPELPHRSR